MSSASSTITNETTVGQLVVERPSRARILEYYGLDYCCGGGVPLGEACAAKGLDPDAVARAIAENDQAAPVERSWAEAPLAELIDHIMEAHHAYLREALPRISGLLQKVENAHADRKPEASEARRVFAGFRQDMEAHLLKEERILFPMVLAMEQGERPVGFPASVAAPIHVMEAEHDDAGAALALLRRLMDDYVAPDWACNTYRATLDALAEIEANTHQHVHKENNILFPRAAELERANTVVRW